VRSNDRPRAADLATWRGINLANALEADATHEWRMDLADEHFDVVARAGFDAVRLPVRWSDHADDAPPYTISDEFLARVDRAVDAALTRGLNLVLDVHHYHQLTAAPEEQAQRYLGIWRQIAQRYADRPGRLAFELLNEPRDAMTAARWNELHPRALAAVRESNPDRVVLISPADLGNPEGLSTLELPDDEQLVVTVHYYAPFRFTHQGATWVEGTQAWIGTTWGEPAEREAVRADLTTVAEWASTAGGRPVFLGEFGAFHRADLASRVAWTACVRSEAERLGFGWAYWEFGTDFGAYDLEVGQWRGPLRAALLDP
jgi:endoglucanase